MNGRRDGRPWLAPARRLRAWAADHLRSLLATAGRLSRAPLNSALTAAAIGIALALPAGLYAVVGDLGRLAGGWDIEPQVVVYLEAGLDTPAIDTAAGAARALDGVAGVTVIGPEQALEEYSAWSGFGEAVAALGENPLPAVLLVRPRTGTAEGVEAVRAALSALPRVGTAVADGDWLRRFEALGRLARQAVWIVGVLLSLAVFLAVGNAVRLGLAGASEEMEVMRLFGATEAFVQRPFLYQGLLLGLAGGLLAWAVVGASVVTLGSPVAELASLYGLDFRLSGLGWRQGCTLILIGGGLGLGGARLAVGRYRAETRNGR